jgi:hypothetical protein
MANIGSSAPTRKFRLPILDVLGLVIGYGMAALFFRAFWPIQGLHPALAVPAIALYLWLGLAMSSPALLLRVLPDHSRTDISDRGNRTGSELAWLWIGIYWIIMALLVIPTRLTQFRAIDTILLAVLPFASIVVARIVKPAHNETTNPEHRWTRQAAVVLIITWPLAWLCLMILGRTLP